MSGDDEINIDFQNMSPKMLNVILASLGKEYIDLHKIQNLTDNAITTTDKIANYFKSIIEKIVDAVINSQAAKIILGYVILFLVILLVLGTVGAFYTVDAIAMPLAQINAKEAQLDVCKYDNSKIRGCALSGDVAGRTGGILGRIPGFGGFGGIFKGGLNKFKKFNSENYLTAEPRPKHTSGRCDNENLFEMAGNDSRNQCVDMSSMQSNIKWKLNPSYDKKEWDSIPPALQNKLEKNSVVVIPYTIQGNNVFPDCKSAYYEGDSQAKVQLTDEGGSCRLVSVKPTVNNREVRHNNVKLDDWSDVEFID